MSAFTPLSRAAGLVAVLCLLGLVAMYKWTSLAPVYPGHVYRIKTLGRHVLTRVFNATKNQTEAETAQNARPPVSANESEITEKKKVVNRSERTFAATTAVPNAASASTTTSTMADTGTTTSTTTTTTTTSTQQQKQGLILQWAHPWGAKSEPPFEGQQYGNCIVTYDRSKRAEALAVVFHYTGVPQPYPYPRDPKQFFVWYSWENPWVVRWMENKDLRQFDNGFFNWTMTYRRDSDIYAPYSLMRNVYNDLPKGKDVVDKLMAEKKKIAIWAVSECKGKKGAPWRMKVSDEIFKVIPSLERYGRCFGGRWPHSKMAEAVRESKFYLSFENSLHCRDYITEKLYRNGYQYGAVPVVWGTAKEDYLAIAPPHSFIHVEDFASPTELAKYLLYLDSNDTAYREYFKWREEPEKTWDEQRAEIERLHPGVKTLDAHTYWYGKLCEMVLKGAPPKVIPSLRKVFLENDSEDCVSKT